MPANKLSMQELGLHQLIRIKLKILVLSQFPRGSNARFAPPCGRPWVRKYHCWCHKQ